MGGQFVISLDFELHWGVRDHSSVEQYRENLLGVWQVVPALLQRFEQREVHATWATVGLLHARTRDEALACRPAHPATYSNRALDPYPELERAGVDERADPFHFAGSLVEQIARTRHQELATHTFSHFYCLEAGPTVEDFEADLRAARDIGKRLGVESRSIVFPRNQFSPPHLAALKRVGVTAFRGNPSTWFWAPHAAAGETRTRRALRLADAYLPTGLPRDVQASRDASGAVNVPATRFLRPWTPSMARLEPLKLAHLRREMTRAAERDALCHLWWHPHNFGRHLAENLRMLEEILDHLDVLRARHGMVSQTMAEAAALVA